MTKNKIPVRFNDKLNDKKECWKEYCSGYILSTLRIANRALNYPDFGKRYKYGTLRNEMNKLAKHGKILALPKECPKRFILPEWAHRPEYSCVQRTDKKGTVGRFDFLSYLESLDWSSPLAVHDLRLCFSVYQLNWKGIGWEYHKGSNSFSRRFDLTYPVSVQCYDTGSVMVNVKCSGRPFELDFDGLLSLTSLLGEVRNSLHALCIPEPMVWRIVQWHLNRDSKKIKGGGLDVNLTFRDFFEDSAQFYYKRSYGKMRAEVVQSPKRSIKEVFEDILNRDDYPKKEGS